ncbi:15-hydroxyprostaglandin dehydrogenase [NAD(+)]-like [Amblyomma americanum]
MEVSGSVALVTGGSGYFGRAVAKHLLDRGAKVAIADYDKKTGQDIEKQLRQKYGENNAVFFECDVTNDEVFEQVFIETINKFGRLDILVNSAGVPELPDWKKVFAVDAMAVYQGTLLGMKFMDKSSGWKGGHIVNVASITGFMSCPPVPSYASAKAAVISFTRSLGSEQHFKRTGVTVNCICPDAMETPLLKGLLDSCVHGGPEAIAVAQYFKESILDPEKTAMGVVKLIEERINGAALIALRTGEFVYHKFEM